MSPSMDIFQMTDLCVIFCDSRVSMEKVAVHKYPLRVAPARPAKNTKNMDSRGRFEALDREATKECLAGKRVAQQDSSDKYGM